MAVFWYKHMTFNVITTQPQIYDSFLQTGLIARGIDKKIIKIKIHNLYDFGIGIHKSVDDTPYGGGPGMILRADVMAKALPKIKTRGSKTILLTPQGCQFGQKDAKRLAKQKELILIAGRFEGYDERIRQLADEEISIGDYVLTSGDLPAMVLVDAISRQVPGFIDKKESLMDESFNNNLLEYPQFTRPDKFKDKKVPRILLSGDHQKIAQWRKKQAIRKTQKYRPDLTK